MADTALKTFTKAMLEYAFDGSDASGADIQELAEKLGLVRKVKYDPSAHGPSDVCEPGDDWYVPTF